MQDLPLNSLRAFAAVYEHGGVRAAARELEVAHSAVSRHLAELEQWLGVSLTRADGRRHAFAFTPQGNELGRAMMQELREIGRVTASIREARSANSVTVTTTPSFAARWLLPRLPAFDEAHPRIDISVVVDQRLVELEHSDINIAIRIGRGPWPGQDCELLMDDLLYPVMSPSFWKKSGRPDEPRELLGMRMLHDRDPEASWETWRDRYGPETLDIRTGPRFASSDLVLRAAVQGQGVTLARHRLAADDIASGALVRPFGELSIHLKSAYWLVRSPRFRAHSATGLLIDWLKQETTVPVSIPMTQSSTQIS